MSVTKAVSGATSYGIGDEVAYTLTPRLNGGMALDGVPVRVVDTLGAGLSFVSASGSGWTCTPAGQQITCDLPAAMASNYTNLPAITVRAQVQQTGTLANSATVAMTGRTDPNTNNNTTPDVFITATDVSDLQITKSASNYQNGQGRGHSHRPDLPGTGCAYATWGRWPCPRPRARRRRSLPWW